MKNNIINNIGIVAAVLFMTACTQEDINKTGADGRQPITITVTDCGYSNMKSKDQPSTRTTENEFKTVFTAGDACGLYVVNNGEITHNNVKITAYDAGISDNIVWKTEGEYITSQTGEESYFLYYPYQENMTGKIVLTDASDDEFFAPLISKWQIKLDQSDYKTGYSASDLMTAKGNVTTDGKAVSISFNMRHQTLMYRLEVPKIEYQFTNNGLSNYTVSYTLDFLGDAKACQMPDGTYRFLINEQDITSPDNMTILYISYDNDTKRKILGPLPAEGFRGMYMNALIDGAGTIEKSHTLQAGDYFMKDGTLISRDEQLTDTQKSNCIGIVVYVGHNQNDDSDYNLSGIGEEKCHGYVAALQDATEEKCVWGPCGVELGLFQSKEINNLENPDTEWNGYVHTQAIINTAGNEENLTIIYPATYHAVAAYENIFPSPIKSSGWFLPSIGQMLTIKAQNEYIQAAGGNELKTDSYWSSTECSDGSGNNSVISMDNNSKVSKTTKNETFCIVRPILTF